MKNTNLCPKCGGSEILRIPGWTGSRGTGNNIPTGWTIFHSVKVTRFLCADCGFSEEWIESQQDIAKLRAKHKLAVSEKADVKWQSSFGISASPPLLMCDICGEPLTLSEESYICPRCS